MTESITVFQALQNVAQDISHIGKNQRNTTQGFKFRGIDDVLNAIHEPLAKHGVAFIPVDVRILSETERTTKTGSVQFYLRANVTYRIIGPAGDDIFTTVIAEAADTGDKCSSKLMSMAYKYAAFQVLSIPVAGMDDADNDTPEQVEPKSRTRAPSAAAKRASDESKKDLHDRLGKAAADLGQDMDTITAKFRKENGGVTLEDFLQLPPERIHGFVRQVVAFAAQASKSDE